MNSIAPIVRINRVLSRLDVPFTVNEHIIETLLSDLDKSGVADDTLFWLTTARLTELALLCAGHYADNCEFTAAGDLLLNPRKIRVHVPPDGRTFIKKRHGRLSDQLAALPALDDGRPTSAREADCVITAPALLPLLHGRLQDCGIFNADYVNDVAVRMLRIADTISFLAAYQSFSNEALVCKLRCSGAEQRAEVERHLCRFERTHFDRLGRQIDAILDRREAWNRSAESKYTPNNAFVPVINH